jgi:hypothetical protein
MLLRPFVRYGRPGLIGRTAGETIVVGGAPRPTKAPRGLGRPTPRPLTTRSPS